MSESRGDDTVGEISKLVVGFTNAAIAGTTRFEVVSLTGQECPP